ncbi:MAG: hemolysin family protein [Acidimicrobiales bacterium]|nr:hemolysin family protein [Acidimicrobiales bacterium]
MIGLATLDQAAAAEVGTSAPPWLVALGLLLVVALIAGNGYFVAAEFSFVAARRTRLADAFQTGDQRSGRALDVVGRLSFMLSGAQLGITVTSLLVGFIAEPTLGRALQPVMRTIGVPDNAAAGVALSVGFVLATASQMVFGELAPKNLAIAKPEPVARWLAPSTLAFLRLGGPVITLFDGSANRLLRVLGIEPVEEVNGTVDPDELPHIVDASSEAGSLSGSQAELLRRALDFRERDAGEVMVPWNRVVSIPVDAVGADLQHLLATTRHMRFPVVDEWEEVLGMVHAKDLLGVPADRRAVASVGDLSRPVLAVPESAGLHRVLAELRSSSSPLAIVVDEHGGTAGVLTIEDLLEELVGDIEDEFDVDTPESIVDLGHDRWLLPGDLRLHEVGRETDLVLPEGPYDTVAGLIMDRLGRIPVVGDRVHVSGTELRIVAMDRRRVVTVELQVHERPVPDEEDQTT